MQTHKHARTHTHTRTHARNKIANGFIPPNNYCVFKSWAVFFEDLQHFQFRLCHFKTTELTTLKHTDKISPSALSYSEWRIAKLLQHSRNKTIRRLVSVLTYVVGRLYRHDVVVSVYGGVCADRGQCRNWRVCGGRYALWSASGNPENNRSRLLR